jgi:membrane protease YdiL (CAAX protease family)
LRFNFPVKPGVKAILLFFSLLILQIISLAGILILSFKIEIENVINQKNIPDLAKYLYLGGLYFFMLFNLHLFDRENFRKAFYLSRHRLKHFSKGFLVAFLSLLGLYILENILGFLEFTAFTINFILLGEIFFSSFIIAMTEELLFRNFIFRKLKDDYKLNTAMIISAYIYAQLHFLKFGLSFSQIILPLTGLFFIGIILAYTFYKIDLWFSTGMHMAWIILITYTTRESLLIVNPEYNMLTGGYYPIGGILGIIMAIILLYILSRAGIRSTMSL